MGNVVEDLMMMMPLISANGMAINGQWCLASEIGRIMLLLDWQIW